MLMTPVSFEVLLVFDVKVSLVPFQINYRGVKRYVVAEQWKTYFRVSDGLSCECERVKSCCRRKFHAESGDFRGTHFGNFGQEQRSL
jgi:hypothetical protein